MAKFLKIIGVTILLIGAFTIVLLLWLDRSQEIDFTRLLPATLNTCEGEIEQGTREYDTLMLWLALNKSGWRNYPATVAPGYFYRGNKITINVYENGAVINYGIENTWSQVHVQANTESINGTCHKNS